MIMCETYIEGREVLPLLCNGDDGPAAGSLVGHCDDGGGWVIRWMDVLLVIPCYEFTS